MGLLSDGITFHYKADEKKADKNRQQMYSEKMKIMHNV